MAPQILQWTTAECIEFLRKCAKQYAAIISDEDLDIYVKNFEKNRVAGSTILNFSDSQWNALIPSLGVGNLFASNFRPKRRAVYKKCELHSGIPVERRHQRIRASPL
jgi:hypothetical protein